MRIIDHKTDEIYVTKPVGHLFEKYISKLQITSKEFWGEFSEGRIKKVFLLAVKDFLEEKISLDDFSTLSTNIYYSDKNWTPFEFNGYNDLSSVLDDASELSYYNWRKEKGTMPSYERAMKKVEKYYQENKSFIQDLI